MRMVALTLAASILSSTAMADPVELWRGAREGMSRAEIGELMPAVEARTLGDSEVLTLSGLRMNDAEWKANYQFDGDSLDRVVLSPERDGSTALFLRTKQDLAARYGEPLTCDDTVPVPGLMRSSQCLWRANGVAIELALKDIAGDLFLSVSYFSADPVNGSIF